MTKKIKHPIIFCLISTLIITPITIAIILLSTYNSLKNSIQPQAMPVPKYNIDQTIVKKLNNKRKQIREALTKGKALTCTLNSDEINTLIATAEAIAPFKNSLYVQINNDTITTTTSIPLELLDPEIIGKYLNSKITIKIAKNKNEFYLYIHNIQTNGNNINPKFMNKIIAKFNIITWLQKREDYQEVEKNIKLNTRLKKLAIKNGLIYIEINKAQTIN